MSVVYALTLVYMVEFHQFEQELAQAWDPSVWRDVTVVVAVSGGADSTALLSALQSISQQSSGRLIAAHFNHQLRGAESDGDERFVRQLCQQLDTPCEVARAETALVSTGDGLEAEARQQRYQFLRELANHCGARYVVTAHTADDQAETVLHRLVRGTGLAGLAGIPATRRLSEMTTVIRPLLSVPRQAVQAYLHDRGQAFREDSSNELTVFTRNRIRHQLLPLLAQRFNPQVVPSLLRLANLAREAQHVIDAVVDPLFEASLTHRTSDRVDLTRAPLLQQPPYLVRELLVRIWKLQHWPRQDMGEAKWGQLCAMLQGDDGEQSRCRTFPGKIRVEVSDVVATLRRC